MYLIQINELNHNFDLSEYFSEIKMPKEITNLIVNNQVLLTEHYLKTLYSCEFKSHFTSYEDFVENIGRITSPVYISTYVTISHQY